MARVQNQKNSRSFEDYDTEMKNMTLFDRAMTNLEEPNNDSTVIDAKIGNRSQDKRFEDGSSKPTNKDQQGQSLVLFIRSSEIRQHSCP